MRKTELSDAALCKAVAEMDQGLIDADLGGGVMKKRVPLPGRGKSGGARTLVATNKGDRWFFLYGFAKNQRDSRRVGGIAEACRGSAQAFWRRNSRLAHCRRYAMTPKRRAKSRILEAVHETARELHTAGFIDKRRMREYDALCLAPVRSYSSKRIRALRKRHKLSQAVLASVLNTSLSTIRQWEIGEKRPSGPSLKLLDLLDRKGLEALI